MSNTAQIEDLINQAKSLLQTGNYEAAESRFMEVLEKESSPSTDTLFNLGLLSLRRGQGQTAVDYWERALSVNPDHFDSNLNLGYLYSQVQDFNKALAYLEKAHAQQEDRDDLVLQMAQILCHIGEVDRSTDLLVNLITKDPENDNAYLLLSQVKVLQKDIKEAEKVLQNLLNIHPSLPEAHINLGHLSEGNGEGEKAKACYKKAVELVPFHFLANFELGRFLFEEGNTNESIEYLRKASELQPNDWPTHEKLGDAYQEIGQFDLAITHYKKCLEINPYEIRVKQSLSRVLSRFVPPWHSKMLADHERNDAFEGALKNMINKDTVALDIGTGSGLLAMMAARHGAKKVYACEQSKYIAEVAKQNIINNQLTNKIQLFQSKSSQINESQLDPKPNLIVAEIFDSGLLGEYAIPSFRHALENLCSENTRIIPKAAEVKGRLIHAPKAASVNPMKKISGFDVSAFDQFRVPEEYVTQQLSEITHEFCSEEFKILEVDFENLWAPMAANQCIRFIASIPVEQEKPIHGVAFWFTLFMDGQIQLSSAPGRKDNHWGQAISYFNEPVSAKAGQKLSLTVNYTDTKIWFEDPKVV